MSSRSVSRAAVVATARSSRDLTARWDGSASDGGEGGEGGDGCGTVSDVEGFVVVEVGGGVVDKETGRLKGGRAAGRGGCIVDLHESRTGRDERW